MKHTNSSKRTNELRTYGIIEQTSDWKLKVSTGPSSVYSTRNSVKPDGKIPLSDGDLATIINNQLSTRVIICLTCPHGLVVTATDNNIAITLDEEPVSRVCCSCAPNSLAIAALQDKIALVRQTCFELSVGCTKK